MRRIDALGFIENGRRLISGSSNDLRMWDLRDLSNQFKYRNDKPNENWKIADLRQQNWVNFSDQISKNFEGSVSDRLMSLMNDTKLDYSLHGRFLIAPYATGLSLIDTQSAIARDVRLVTAEPPMGKDDNRSLSDMTISHDASTTLCVLHGKWDFQSDSRRLYAVNGETGAILAEWSLPDGLKSSTISLATHEVGGEVACWAGGHQFVFTFSPKNGSPRGFKLLDSNSISHLVLRDGSNSFVLTAGTGSSSVVMLAHGEAGKDAQVAPGTSIPDSSVAGVVVAASANITGEENGMAINPDGSRIAVAIRGGWYDTGVSEVLLFNRHLDLVMKLPGSPDSFHEMQLSPDGTILRATASFMNYEQDLGLQSRLELARSRLQDWTQHDDRADFVTKDSAALKENDWERESSS